MAYVVICMKFLFLVFILTQSDAVSEQCFGLNNKISRLEGHVLKILTELEYRNETLVRKYYVTNLPSDTVICSHMSLSGSSIFMCCQSTVIYMLMFLRGCNILKFSSL
jgi:hypothetical protein